MESKEETPAKMEVDSLKEEKPEIVSKAKKEEIVEKSEQKNKDEEKVPKKENTTKQLATEEIPTEKEVCSKFHFY